MDAANVVVTGAAGALGRVVARHFLERGHPLVLVDRDLDALRAAYAGVGGDLRFVAVDLADAAATGAALGDALRGDAAGVLCNIAGGFTMGHPVHDADGDDWGRMLAMNVSTMLGACRAVVPGMIAAARGRIVNVAAASATPANRAAMPDADPGKWVTPEQLADVIGFLASDAASAIHGAVIPVVGLS